MRRFARLHEVQSLLRFSRQTLVIALYIADQASTLVDAVKIVVKQAEEASFRWRRRHHGKENWN